MKEFSCVHGCSEVYGRTVAIREEIGATTRCPICGTKYRMVAFGVSSGGWGNGPYYDRGPKPEDAVCVLEAAILYHAHSWREADVVTPGAVVAESYN